LFWRKDDHKLNALNRARSYNDFPERHEVRFGSPKWYPIYRIDENMWKVHALEKSKCCYIRGQNRKCWFQWFAITLQFVGKLCDRYQIWSDLIQTWSSWKTMARKNMHIFEDSQIQTNQQYSNGGKGVSPNRYLFNKSLHSNIVGSFGSGSLRKCAYFFGPLFSKMTMSESNLIIFDIDRKAFQRIVKWSQIIEINIFYFDPGCSSIYFSLVRGLFTYFHRFDIWDTILDSRIELHAFRESHCMSGRD
jgi:hypothetical protein